MQQLLTVSWHWEMLKCIWRVNMQLQKVVGELFRRLKVKCYSSPEQVISHLRGVTVLTATRHRWTHPAITAARQASTRFTYPRGMEGLPRWLYYIPRWFTHPQLVTHPSTNPAAHSRVLNSRPFDHKSEALIATLPSHPEEVPEL